MDINRIGHSKLWDLRSTPFKGRLGMLVHTMDKFTELKWKNAAICTTDVWNFILVHKIWCLNMKSHMSVSKGAWFCSCLLDFV